MKKNSSLFRGSLPQLLCLVTSLSFFQTAYAGAEAQIDEYFEGSILANDKATNVRELKHWKEQRNSIKKDLKKFAYCKDAKNPKSQEQFCVSMIEEKEQQAANADSYVKKLENEIRNPITTKSEKEKTEALAKLDKYYLKLKERAEYYKSGLVCSVFEETAAESCEKGNEEEDREKMKQVDAKRSLLREMPNASVQTDLEINDHKCEEVTLTYAICNGERYELVKSTMSNMSRSAKSIQTFIEKDQKKSATAAER